MSAEASQVAFIDALERLAQRAEPAATRSPFVTVRMSFAMLEALDAEVSRRRVESPGLNVTRSDVIREALVRVVSNPGAKETSSDAGLVGAKASETGLAGAKDGVVSK